MSIGTCLASCGACGEALCENCIINTLGANGLRKTKKNIARLRGKRRYNSGSFQPARFSEAGIELNTMLIEANK